MIFCLLEMILGYSMELNRFLSKLLRRKTWDEAYSLHDLEIPRDRPRGALGLSKGLIDHLLKRFNMNGCSPSYALILKGIGALTKRF